MSTGARLEHARQACSSLARHSLAEVQLPQLPRRTTMITVTVLQAAPGFARGLIRDLRVRWALEEAGLPYDTLPIGQAEQSSAEYRKIQPFGQVPAYRDDQVSLFESGAIALHIAEQSETLLSKHQPERGMAVAWLFAALNTVEPAVSPLVSIDLFHSHTGWGADCREIYAERARTRLSQLGAALKGQSWLGPRFTIADLVMATVLRVLRHTDLVENEAGVADYLARCEARPAFKRALARHFAETDCITI